MTRSAVDVLDAPMPVGIASGIGSTVARAKRRFAPVRGYLNACSLGLPPLDVVDAMRQDALDWSQGLCSPASYGAIVEDARALYADIVSAPIESVSIGSQTSVMAGTIAGSVPPGAEVLCVSGDFSSMVYPFLVQGERGVRVRHVALDELANAIGSQTYLVAFSLVQSGDGRVADVDAIVEAARRHGTYTFCDLTQAAGAMPVDATRFDVTATNAYKWLMCPRGVAFMTASPGFARTLTPNNAGWYAGEDVWSSLYGPAMRLATSVRSFDVSPAWPSWVGARVALDIVAGLDLGEVHRHNVRRANAFCGAIGRAPQDQAIVSWKDPGGAALAALGSAGVTASGRGGSVRVAFHLWNDDDDVALASAALTR
jgi:selenocysteine lyase/cysteine desulfurase